jgi:glycosyltransferase involved in cell wall biosynthesis
VRPLLLLRVYTGLDTRRWSISSTPAILKLIERLEERAIPATAVFLAKRRGDLTGSAIVPADFGRLRHVRAFLVPYKAPGFVPEPFAMALNWLRQFALVLRLLRHERHDLVYADRGNLAFAAWLAWLGVPVVWRCLGVASLLYRRAGRSPGKRLLAALDRLHLAAPIALSICTLDGSPWYRFLGRPGQRRRLAVLFNGVDRPAPAAADRAGLAAHYDLPAGVPVIFAVSRLEATKHVIETLSALAGLKARGVAFRAIIAGYGSLEAEAKAFVAAHRLDRHVLLPGRIPHASVPDHAALADIVVSLSLGGNLSNTTLEALAAGACVIAFEADARSGTDRVTDQVAPPEVMVRIPRREVAAGLEAALTALLANKPRLEGYRSAARAFAARHLPTWRERLDLEIALLEDVAAGRLDVERRPGLRPLPEPAGSRQAP